MPERFLDRNQVAAFWDRARAGAAAEQQTGYLQDEWPPALGRHRFEGELRQVSRWLDELAVARGACLDVGCGVGVWLEALAARFDRVHGIDLSREMVASAKARVAARGLARVTVAHQDLCDLDRSDRYDLVFVGGALTYIDDEQVDGVVANLAALLAPGGLLILRESTARTPWHRDTPLAVGLFGDRSAPRPAYHAIYRTPASYRDLARRHGLEVVRWQPNPHYSLADLTGSWLRVVDRIGGGWLARAPARAERAARAIHALRPLTLLPPYYLGGRGRRLGNYWYVCRRAKATAAAASSSFEL